MWKLQNADDEIVSCDDNKVVTSYFRQLLWNHSARLTVQLSRFSVVLVDGLPKFQEKLERPAFVFSG